MRFNFNESFGRIVPQKDFPSFDIKLKINDFREGEVVTAGDKDGIVESWNNKIETLKVSTESDFDTFIVPLLEFIKMQMIINSSGSDQKKLEDSSKIVSEI